jgi:hypothetical protein
VLPLQHHIPEECPLLLEEHAQEPQGRGRKFVLSTTADRLANDISTQLCWSCSEREQNDTLSSDESEGSGGGGSGYDSDDTNPFRGTDVSHLLPFHKRQHLLTKIKVGNLLSIGNERSSGGMPVNSSGGTIFGGGSSVASRSITTSSVSDFSDAPRITGDDASSISSFNTPGKKGFNPMNYGDPGLRQTSSVASRDSPKSKAWASVRPPASKVHSHAARQVQKEVKKRQPKANTNPYLLQDQASNKSLAIKGFGDEEEIPSDESDGEEEPAPKPSAPPARPAQANGTFSQSYIQAVTADKDQDDRGNKFTSKEPKRQTTTDISRAVYSQEEAYHEIATFSDGSLSDDSEGYYGVEVDEGFHG